MSSYRRKPRVGDVVQISLPTGRYAYGRVLRDASVAFYSDRSDKPGEAPIGSRDYQFTVGVYEDVLGSPECPVVGHDPSHGEEDQWPPPYRMRDSISGEVRIYYKGTISPSTEIEIEGLEPAAVWDLGHLVDRLMGLHEGQSR
jgi:hypothetical protein